MKHDSHKKFNLHPTVIMIYKSCKNIQLFYHFMLLIVCNPSLWQEKFQITTKKLEDKDKSDSKLTIEVIKEIANNVDPMIRLASETPCKLEGGMLPILDV